MQRTCRHVYDMHRFSTPHFPSQYYDGGSGSSDSSETRQKKHSTTSLINTRAYWPYPSAAAIAAASGAECQSPGACSSSLEFEAMAAVHRLSVAVRDISVSEMLPRTPQLIFVNVTTLEGQPYCLELTAKGWRITSLRTDCMQGDFTRMELFTVYYESIYDLMSVISPSFKQHAAALASRKSQSSCGEDDDSEYGAIVPNDNSDGLVALNNYYEMPKSASASRRPSLTPAGGAGSRRPSLKHASTDPHVIQLCPQCSCVSLLTLAGESIADVLLDNDPSVIGSADSTPSHIQHAAPIDASGAMSTCTCRYGANYRLQRSDVDESLKFPRRKLRNISEGAPRTDDDIAERDLDKSCIDELKFNAPTLATCTSSGNCVSNGGALRQTVRSSRSSLHSSSTQPSSSASSRRSSRSSRSD